MKRDAPDVLTFPTLLDGATSWDAWPAPGPTVAWTAVGVIETLEPLALPERVERLRQVLDKRQTSVTVLLDNPHDPHNASAVLRSCDAFGVQQVHVAEVHESFALARKVAKGSHHWVDVLRYPSRGRALSALLEREYEVVVTHPDGELEPEDLCSIPRLALALGNERDGVDPQIYSAARRSVRIPMCGFVESLNMSVSAAILVRAACRGRAPDLTPAERQNLLARWLRHSVPRSDEILSQVDAR